MEKNFEDCQSKTKGTWSQFSESLLASLERLEEGGGGVGWGQGMIGDCLMIKRAIVI